MKRAWMVVGVVGSGDDGELAWAAFEVTPAIQKEIDKSRGGGEGLGGEPGDRQGGGRAERQRTDRRDGQREVEDGAPERRSGEGLSERRGRANS